MFSDFDAFFVILMYTSLSSHCGAPSGGKKSSKKYVFSEKKYFLWKLSHFEQIFTIQSLRIYEGDLLTGAFLYRTNNNNTNINNNNNITTRPNKTTKTKQQIETQHLRTINNINK